MREFRTSGSVGARSGNRPGYPTLHISESGFDESSAKARCPGPVCVTPPCSNSPRGGGQTTPCWFPLAVRTALCAGASPLRNCARRGPAYGSSVVARVWSFEALFCAIDSHALAATNVDARSRRSFAGWESLRSRAEHGPSSRKRVVQTSTTLRLDWARARMTQKSGANDHRRATTEDPYAGPLRAQFRSGLAPARRSLPRARPHGQSRPLPTAARTV